MAEDGNQAQVRVIGEQMFDIWEDKQKRKSMLHGSLPAWIACVLSLGAVLWQAAITSSDVNENRRRIEAIEAQQLTQANDNRAVIDRLARIEAKLDVVAEAKGIGGGEK